MNTVWILTIGNSDVAMTSKDDWEDLRREKRLGQVYHKFKVTELSKNTDGETLYSLSARVLGDLYEDVLDNDEYWETLRFPLLKGFVAKLKGTPKELNRIIILLTNQEDIFKVNNRSSSSPFWQDTCKLESILKKYFAREFSDDFVNSKVEFSYLKPLKEEEGLDDWDATLKLMQAEFMKWENNSWITQNDLVIVSHQAGTPAISSAVQLTCLIRFGKEVEFLVSSELNPDRTELLSGSSYFKTLQFKKLKDLLDRHDYSEIASVLENIYLEDSGEKQRLNHLLDLAKLWNNAEFEEFASKMGEPATSRAREWWWSAYESAYLGVVRLKQGNTVEAIFHSFRAVEGLLRKWAENKQNLVPNSRGNLMIALPSGEKFNLYGKALYNCLEKCYTIDTSEDIYKFGHLIFDKRNDLFHQLLGLDQSKVFDFWETDRQIDWEKRIIGCLNFIAKEDLPKEFESIEEASLMAQVHEKLEEVIKSISY
ncbi:hypothetical protein [Pseudanabaena sp. BC1403]|uniref:hypothetical protein n=1 Tax=Pseudanabaena sp. BC1403 TaxID=2043171 RepID=UPI000CD95530|nr:hypothetical protein [Pseudanabaena sp. BC1403]